MQAVSRRIARRRVVDGWIPRVAVFLAACLTAAAQPARSGLEPDTIEALKRLSLEELVSLEVSTVSRRDQRAIDAAAAVHVITADEIRRSGARSIPDALRLAPNLHVARTDSRNWAISARGFNASFANKLLVLMDGRSVYTPLYAGVFWDVQDTFLADVERIEVISGPGATIWGANAVNGVINVISKPAAQTQGVLLTGGVGTEERAFGGVRYGGRVGDDVFYRVYVKSFTRDDARNPDGTETTDSWDSTQGGFRVDWEASEVSKLTVQGDYYGGRGEQALPGDITHSGGNVLTRWTHRLSDTEQFQVQAYVDHTERLAPGDFGDRLDTFDIDGQFEWDLAQRHHLMAGAAYRFTRNRVTNFQASAFLPERLERSLVSGFVQDEVEFPDLNVKAAFGVKLEHNDYTGLEVQPSARAAWILGKNTLWGAVSRAVRTPSRFDRHLFAPPEPPHIIAGGADTRSEELIAYEIGWRGQLRNQLLLDATVFLHDYDHIRTLSLGPPFVFENNGEGEIYGLELEATWQVTPSWRLSAGYTRLEEDLRVKPGRADLSEGQGEAFDPRNQFQLGSSLEIGTKVEFDVWLRYVDELGNTSARGFGIVPEYTTVDARLGWFPDPSLELAIVGQNLLNSRHGEFGRDEIERSVYGQFTWRY